MKGNTGIQVARARGGSASADGSLESFVPGAGGELWHQRPPKVRGKSVDGRSTGDTLEILQPETSASGENLLTWLAINGRRLLRHKEHKEREKGSHL